MEKDKNIVERYQIILNVSNEKIFMDKYTKIFNFLNS